MKKVKNLFRKIKNFFKRNYQNQKEIKYHILSEIQKSNKYTLKPSLFIHTKWDFVNSVSIIRNHDKKLLDSVKKKYSVDNKIYGEPIEYNWTNKYEYLTLKDFIKKSKKYHKKIQFKK